MATNYTDKATQPAIFPTKFVDKPHLLATFNHQGHDITTSSQPTGTTIITPKTLLYRITGSSITVDTSDNTSVTSTGPYGSVTTTPTYNNIKSLNTVEQKLHTRCQDQSLADVTGLSIPPLTGRPHLLYGAPDVLTPALNKLADEGNFEYLIYIKDLARSKALFQAGITWEGSDDSKELIAAQGAIAEWVRTQVDIKEERCEGLKKATNPDKQHRRVTTPELLEFIETRHVPNEKVKDIPAAHPYGISTTSNLDHVPGPIVLALVLRSALMTATTLESFGFTLISHYKELFKAVPPVGTYAMLLNNIMLKTTSAPQQLTINAEYHLQMAQANEYIKRWTFEQATTKFPNYLATLSFTAWALGYSGQQISEMATSTISADRDMMHEILQLSYGKPEYFMTTQGTMALSPGFVASLSTANFNIAPSHDATHLPKIIKNIDPYPKPVTATSTSHTNAAVADPTPQIATTSTATAKDNNPFAQFKKQYHKHPAAGKKPWEPRGKHKQHQRQQQYAQQHQQQDQSHHQHGTRFPSQQHQYHQHQSSSTAMTKGSPHSPNVELETLMAAVMANIGKQLDATSPQCLSSSQTNQNPQHQYHQPQQQQSQHQTTPQGFFSQHQHSADHQSIQLDPFTGLSLTQRRSIQAASFATNRDQPYIRDVILDTGCTNTVTSQQVADELLFMGCGSWSQPCHLQFEGISGTKFPCQGHVHVSVAGEEEWAELTIHIGIQVDHILLSCTDIPKLGRFTLPTLPQLRQSRGRVQQQVNGRWAPSAPQLETIPPIGNIPQPNPTPPINTPLLVTPQQQTTPQLWPIPQHTTIDNNLVMMNQTIIQGPRLMAEDRISLLPPDIKAKLLATNPGVDPKITIPTHREEISITGGSEQSTQALMKELEPLLPELLATKGFTTAPNALYYPNWVDDPTKLQYRNSNIKVDNPRHMEFLRAETAKDLRNGVVSECSPQWFAANPRIRQVRADRFVIDRAGKLRAVSQVKQTNKAIKVPPNTHFPTFETLIPKQADPEQLFTGLDLQEAYHSIQYMPYDHWAQTRFKVGVEEFYYIIVYEEDGKFYRYNVLTYGLSDAPAFYSSVLQAVLLPHKQYAGNYLDDILISGSGQRQHISNVIAVVKTLLKYNFKIKLAKCQWLGSEIKFLGCIINGCQIKPDPDKLLEIRTAETPTTPRQLKKFIGKVAWLGRFMLNRAKTLRPLYLLTKAKKFTEALKTQVKTAVAHVQEDMANYIALTLPDFNFPFYIWTDASEKAMAGVLAQLIDGKWVIIETHSAVFRPAQENYTIYRKEILAILTSLVPWDKWIRHSVVTIVTDNKSATHGIRSSPTATKIEKSWIDKINEYQYDLIHISGNSNIWADALTRETPTRYTPNTNKYIEVKPNPNPTMPSPTPATPTPVTPTAPSPTHLHQSSSQPVIDFPNLRYSHNFAPPTPPPRQLVLPTDRLKHRLLTDEAIVYCTDLTHRKRAQVYPSFATQFTNPPQSQKADLTTEAHDGDHGGAVIMMKRIRQAGFDWPGLENDCRTVVEKCRPCLQFNPAKLYYHSPQTVSATHPMAHTQVDLAGPFPTSEFGMSYVLVYTCVYSVYTIFEPLPNKEADTIADVLVRLFCDYGAPQILQSDNGTEFSNKKLREVLDIIKTEYRLSAEYNPRANGRVESKVNQFKLLLRKLITSNQTSSNIKYWCQFIKFIQWSLNTRESTVTLYTPFYLMFGRNSYGFMGNNFEAAVFRKLNITEWLKSMVHKQTAIHDEILQHREKLWHYQLSSFLKHHLVDDQILTTDTPVLVRNPRENIPIFESKWWGPYLIAGVDERKNYTLKVFNGQEETIIRGKFPRDRLQVISPDSYLGLDEPVLAFLDERKINESEIFPEGKVTEIMVRYINVTINDEWLPKLAIRKELVDHFDQLKDKTFPFYFDKTFLINVYGLNHDVVID